MESHLFTVEIMLKAPTNGQALERLLHILNSEAIIQDYKIVRGIQLGSKIDAALNDLKPQQQVQTSKRQVNEKASEENKTKDSSSMGDHFKEFVKNGSLVRLHVVKAKGIRFSIPVRILNYNENNQQITVYHVDEKKVYLFNFNEIEDFVVT